MKTDLRKRKVEYIYVALILTENDLTFFRERVDSSAINIYGFLKIMGNSLNLSPHRGGEIFGYATDLIVMFTVEDEAILDDFDYVRFIDDRSQYIPSLYFCGNRIYSNLKKLDVGGLDRILFNKDCSLFLDIEFHQQYIRYDDIDLYIHNYFTLERSQRKELIRKCHKKKLFLPHKTADLIIELKKKTRRQLESEYDYAVSGISKGEYLVELSAKILWKQFISENIKDISVLREKYRHIDEILWNTLITDDEKKNYVIKTSDDNLKRRYNFRK